METKQNHTGKPSLQRSQSPHLEGSTKSKQVEPLAQALTYSTQTRIQKAKSKSGNDRPSKLTMCLAASYDLT